MIVGDLENNILDFFNQTKIKEDSKSENLSLSDTETLLNQKMDGSVGGDNY